jgi:arylsulfatase A
MNCQIACGLLRWISGVMLSPRSAMRATCWFQFVVCCGLSSVHLQVFGDEAMLPNFVIIMADDMGYGDAGCYGGTHIETPNLDRLAASGMRFTDFHSSGNVCSPTRAGLLTGRYQYRAGLDQVVNADPAIPAHHTGLQRAEFTFAEALKQRGYATALMGKWHLGYDVTFNPTHQGFDQFFGFVSGNIDYVSHLDRMNQPDWWQGRELRDEPGYSTHLITRHAVEFIEQHRDQPFCLYVAHEAVHAPWQAPGDPAVRGPLAQSRDSRKPRAETFRSMMAAMDDGVGRIMGRLDSLGLAGNTLVFFLSDNGPAGGSAGPLRGRKSSDWEGGHRVPAIARWPGRIKAGAVSDQLSMSIDLMPTILEFAGIEFPTERPFDGQSLVPTLLDEKALKPRQLFWNHRAMRDGPWKLILGGKGSERDSVGLYNLDLDIGESNNLAETYPERVAAMRLQLTEWSADVRTNVTPQP